MKSQTLIATMKEFAQRNKDLIGTELESVGPSSLSDNDFLEEQAPFREATGVYIISDKDDEILYVGTSEDSIGHRIWQRLKAIRAGQYGQVQPFKVEGLKITPMGFGLLYEKLGICLYVKASGKLPPLNGSM